MMKGKTISAIIALMLVVTMMLTACGSEGKDTSEEKETGKESEDTTNISAEVPEGWENALDGKTGLEPAPAEKDKIVIGHTPSAMNTAHQMIIYGLQEEIKNLGLEDKVELIVQAPSGQSAVDEQVAIVESFIEQGVDAISCAPSAGSDEALLVAYEKAAKAGIPVFEVNTPYTGSVSPHLVSNIGYDQSNASAMMAQWLVDDAGGKDVNVVVLEGMAGIHAYSRQEGFMSIIDKNSNIHIVADEYTDDWSVENAMSNLENILAKNKEVDYIWTQYDELSIGAYTVVKQLGLQEQIKVLGFEHIPEAQNSIKNNEMWATVDNGQKEMDAGIKSLTDKITGHPEQELSIETLAADIFVSQYYLIRKFRNSVGMTPHQFCIQNRIRKSQRILDEEKTIGRIAAEMGFYDQSHFDRAFQKVVGISPSEYVRSKRQIGRST